MILQADLIEEGLKITPYSEAVYGILVAGLIATIIYLARKLDKWQDKYTELAEKSASVISLVEDKLPEPSEHDMIIKGLEDVKHSLERIDDKIGQ